MAARPGAAAQQIAPAEGPGNPLQTNQGDQQTPTRGQVTDQLQAHQPEQGLTSRIQAQPWPDVLPGPLPRKENRMRTQASSPTTLRPHRESITHVPAPNDSQAETLTNEAMDMSHTSTDEVNSDHAQKTTGTKGPPRIWGPPTPQLGPAALRLFGQSSATSEASNDPNTWWHTADHSNRTFPPLPPPIPGRTCPGTTAAPGHAGPRQNATPLIGGMQPHHDRPPPIIPPSFLEPAARPTRPTTLTTSEIRRRSLRNQQRANERTAQGRATIPEWECTTCEKTNWMQAPACRACGTHRSTNAKVIVPHHGPYPTRTDARHHQTIAEATRALRPTRGQPDQLQTAPPRERVRSREPTPTDRHARTGSTARPETATDGQCDEIPHVTGRDIQAAERALQAARDARLPPDLITSLYESVRDLRRRAELEKPHEKRLATARRRLTKIGARLEQITAKIGELHAAREKLLTDYREAEAYVQQLENSTIEGNPKAGIVAARTLILDLSQTGTIPSEIAKLLLLARTAPPTPDGTPPIATTWGRISAIMDSPMMQADRTKQTGQSNTHSIKTVPAGSGQAQAAPRARQRQPTAASIDGDSGTDQISMDQSSETSCERKQKRRTTRVTTTNTDDPIATPSSSTARSPPQRRRRGSREKPQKSPDRRQRNTAVIKAKKQQARNRRHATPTTDTSIAEQE